MKKLLIPLIVFSITSCGGGSTNQPQGGNTAAPTTNTPPTTVPDEETAPSAISAEETAIDAPDCLDALPKNPDKQVYHFEEFTKQEEHYIRHLYYAYPMTKGGYMVLSRCVISEEYSYDDDKCDSYTYQNGRLDTARNVLPVPDINEWLDPTKCKDHDSDVQNAIMAYQTERDNLSYEIDEKTGNITPYRAGYNENWSESYSELLKQLEYTWNGEQFVQQ